MLTLADIPVSRIYTASQLEDLCVDAARVNTNTSMLPIERSKQLEMDDRGQLENGFRFTTTAFRQLCRTLAGGMSSLLDDVAGKRRRKAAMDVEFSPPTAIAIFNRLLRLRFVRMLGRLAVYNVADRTIDGFVGPKYKYLANSAFASNLLEGLASESLKFHRGYLYGRQLALRFVHNGKLPVTTNDGITLFALGRHYANSEIGDASVRAAPMVTLVDGPTALGSYDLRLPHAGRDFQRKLQKLLGSSLRGPDEALLDGWIKALQSQPLIGKEDEFSVDGLARSKSRLERKLVSKGLTQRMAQQVSALSFFGANLAGFPSIEDFANKSFAIGQRTAYDACIALMQTPIRMPLNARERVEQVAYSLLCGRFSL